jgi:hypothetical protein
MLPLTLRPTDIGTPPTFQHLKDYCVFEDGERVGFPAQVACVTPVEVDKIREVRALTKSLREQR